MKTAILGGTFNPPHIGHLVLANEVYEQFNLDRIFFIPTNIAPHKGKENISPSHRLNMLKLSIEGKDYFRIIDSEIKRGGVSYTVDTVKELKVLFPEDDFYLIAGSDLAKDFSSWKNFDELKRLVTIVVVQRNSNLLKTGNDFLIAEITQLHVSSSLIRSYLKQGRSAEYLVRDSVFEYINKHNLYR